MIVREISQDFNQDFPMDDLLNYLSEMILSLTDEEIERESSQLNFIKERLNGEKNRMKSVKKELVVAAKEYQRLSVLKSVLTKVDTLRREGILVGDNRNKISELLATISRKSLRHLRSLEDKLSIYVPEISSKVTYQ